MNPHLRQATAVAHIDELRRLADGRRVHAQVAPNRGLVRAGVTFVASRVRPFGLRTTGQGSIKPSLS
jgi:hypothetical protein